MVKVAVLFAALLLSACATKPQTVDVSPYQDILDWHIAQDRATVEAYSTGKITQAEALARAQESRMNARTRILERAATLDSQIPRPRPFSDPRPITCTTINGITTCH